MVSATVPPVAPGSVARMSIASFLPGNKDGWTRSVWLDRLPLLGVLGIQAFASLRLNNTAFQDEALYLVTGHWERAAWASGTAVASDPGSFFSGSPQLYPVFASYLDSLGGLELARLFSLLCMLSATVAVYWTTRVLFVHQGRRPALFASVAFSLSAPVIFLGHFATFDAPSFTCLVWAAALAAWCSSERKSLWWSGVVGALLVLAVALKYASAIDVPFVLLLACVGLRTRGHRSRALAFAVLSGTVTVSLGALSALTWARGNMTGLWVTTVDRDMGTKTPATTAIGHVVVWSGITLGLMAAGAILLLVQRRRPAVAVLLGIGTFAAICWQIHGGDITSLNKHVVLGLLLGAPLAGVALARLSRVRLGAIIVLVVVWATLLSGLDQSRSLFATWPNTQGLVQTIEPSLKADPAIRTVGDIPEPVEYALWRQSQPWQWTGTYANSFSYHGLTGIAAYRAALAANYFQLVFLNGYFPISQQLERELPSLGFKHTSTVNAAGTTWMIWQRWDAVTDH